MNGKLTRHPIFQRLYKPVQQGELIYLPRGLQFFEQPQGHREHLFKVDEALCERLETHRLKLSLTGRKAYLDIDHLDDEIAFWIDDFRWHPELGIIARGEWTEEGLNAARVYRYLSIHGLERAIIGKIGELAPPTDSQNVGGLVCASGFYAIQTISILPRLPELLTSAQARPRTLGDLVGGVKKRTSYPRY
jgi:hypothetical protein